MELKNDFTIKALEGFGNNDITLPLSEIALVWEEENANLKRPITKMVSTNGQDLKILDGIDTVLESFLAAGVPFFDVRNTQGEDEIKYVVNLDHANVHSVSADSGEAILSVTGVRNKTFYVLDNEYDYGLSPTEFQDLKAEKSAVPIFDAPIYEA